MSGFCYYYDYPNKKFIQNQFAMEKYHTRGSRSIPKLIAFSESGTELFTWGPRLAPAQELLLEWKAGKLNRSRADFEKDLHTWYTRDKGKTIQKEIRLLLQDTVEQPKSTKNAA